MTAHLIEIERRERERRERRRLLRLRRAMDICMTSGYAMIGSTLFEALAPARSVTGYSLMWAAFGVAALAASVYFAPLVDEP